MMTLAEAQTAPHLHGRFMLAIASAVRMLALVVLCLTPVTALVVLGWLTRRTAHDVSVRLAGAQVNPPPRLVLGDADRSGTLFHRLLGGPAATLLANLRAGAGAWVGALALTLPFSLVWLVGWLAGWENSFSKGYEIAGLWPGISIAGVVASVPVLVLLPMAITHQAAAQRFGAIFEFRTITGQVRRAGWRYLVLTVLIAIGGVGVLGARALPTFADQISPAVADGSPEAYEAFAFRFRLLTTSLLVAGLLVVRRAMAWCYAHAAARDGHARSAGVLISGLVLFACAALWIALVFTIYAGQFVNYFWWNWLNQPVLMLPWLG